MLVHAMVIDFVFCSVVELLALLTVMIAQRVMTDCSIQCGEYGAAVLSNKLSVSGQGRMNIMRSVHYSLMWLLF